MERKKIFFEQANLLIEKNVTPLQNLENIHIEKTSNRISGESCRAPRNIPNLDNAAVDGIAFNYQEYQKYQAKLQLCPEIIRAEKKQNLENFPAVKIMTGAAIPKRYDTIAMQEDVIIDNGYVLLPKKIKQNSNVRKAGEDISINQIFLKKGQLIKPAIIARIASTGLDKLQVVKKPKIAIISTGDEIIAPGTKYQPGMIYDANSFMLKTLVEKIGAEARVLPIMKDDHKKIREKIIATSKKSDMLLISGGAGPGVSDYITEILNEIANIIFSQIEIKPGKPLTFAVYNKNIPIFSLPGNPVAVFVCFHMFVAQAIKKLSGRTNTKLKNLFLPIKSEKIITKKPHRTEFWRAKIIQKNNQNWLQKYPNNGSGIIESITHSDGIIQIEQNVTQIKNADVLKFYPYDMLL